MGEIEDGLTGRRWMIRKQQSECGLPVRRMTHASFRLSGRELISGRSGVTDTLELCLAAALPQYLLEFLASLPPSWSFLFPRCCFLPSKVLLLPFSA